MPGNAIYDGKNLSAKRPKISVEDQIHLKSINSDDVKKSDAEVEDKNCIRGMMQEKRINSFLNLPEPKDPKLGRSKTVALPTVYESYTMILKKLYGKKSVMMRYAVKINYVIEKLIKEFVLETYNLKELKLKQRNGSGLKHVSSFAPGKDVEALIDELIYSNFATSRSMVAHNGIRDFFLIQMFTNEKYNKKMSEQLSKLECI